MLHCPKCGCAVARKGYCAPYKRTYNKLWYKKNRKVQLARASHNNEKHRARLYAALAKIKNVPCPDCGGSFPAYVMDFDHLDADEKVENISQMVCKTRKMEEILAEVQKCEVVCSNCHRIRTHNRRTPRGRVDKASTS